jgi:serine/threonine protein phosphatase PrpC
MTEREFSVHISGITDVGAVRQNNEDAIAFEPAHGLAILADGMGGHNAGEVASHLAVETVERRLLQAIGEDAPDYAELLTDAVHQANTAVYERSKLIADCNGMGTTLVVACFDTDQAHIANVGDSRLYLYRGGELNQLTRDHSLVAEMVEKGFMSAEEARESPQKNIITRAVGLQAEVEVDIYQHPLQAGDLCLLCSDGLSDVVDDQGILGCIEENISDIDALSRQLVDKALQAGGPDNISVIVVQLPAN